MGTSNKFLVAAGVVIFLSLIIMFWVGSSRFHNSGHCKMYENYLGTEFSNIVKSKYEDSNNHMYPSIEVGNIKLNLALDITGFYNIVEVGDSLIKKEGYPEVDIYRNNQYLRTHVLDYGCIKYE